MPAAGAGESVDPPEEIANVDVGANGSGTDRAFEESTPGSGDHRVTGTERVEVDLGAVPAPRVSHPAASGGGQ